MCVPMYLAAWTVSSSAWNSSVDKGLGADAMVGVLLLPGVARGGVGVAAGRTRDLIKFGFGGSV